MNHIAATLGIIGAILVSFKRIEGFYLWLIANPMWMYIGLRNDDYGLVVMFGVYTVITINGIWQWKK